MEEQEKKPEGPPKDSPVPRKKKKKRNLRDESVDKDLKKDDIGDILDSGKNETAEQTSKKYRQKPGE